MAEGLPSALLVAILAFVIGYAIRRGSICAVMASGALMRDGRTARMRAFGLAAATAGALILPASWMAPGSAMLAEGRAVTATVLVGGAVFGLGARLNGACTLGTLAHLTGGRTDYLLTVAGIVVGAVLALLVVGAPPEPVAPSPIAGTGFAPAVVFALFAGTVAATLWRRAPRWLRDFRRSGLASFGPFRAMLVIGVAGGLLHAMAGSWTYAGVLTSGAAHLLDPARASITPDAFVAALALVAGGAWAAYSTGTFALRGAVLRDCAALRCRRRDHGRGGRRRAGRQRGALGARRALARGPRARGLRGDDRRPLPLLPAGAPAPDLILSTQRTEPMTDTALTRRDLLASSAVLAAGAALAAGPAGAQTTVSVDGESIAVYVPEESEFPYEVTRTEAEWRAHLGDDDFVYGILRRAETERPKTTDLWREPHEAGYLCAGCDMPLYEGRWFQPLDKGWVFFHHAIPNAVMFGLDGPVPEYGQAGMAVSFATAMGEVHCRRCGSHIGHHIPVEGVFLHCLNGTALKLA